MAQSFHAAHDTRSVPKPGTVTSGSRIGKPCATNAWKLLIVRATPLPSEPPRRSASTPEPAPSTARILSSTCCALSGAPASPRSPGSPPSPDGPGAPGGPVTDAPMLVASACTDWPTSARPTEPSAIWTGPTAPFLSSDAPTAPALISEAPTALALICCAPTAFSETVATP